MATALWFGYYQWEWQRRGSLGEGVDTRSRHQVGVTKGALNRHRIHEAGVGVGVGASFPLCSGAAVFRTFGFP